VNTSQPHRTYAYIVPGGVRKTVQADRVDFTAHHVVFLDTRTVYPTIVLAEEASSVRQLTDVTPVRHDGPTPYVADRALKHNGGAR
jgi:hypothetical protein